MKCRRCGHKWDAKCPRKCPKCRAYDWNKEYKSYEELEANL